MNRVRRRTFLTAAGALLATPFAARAQPAKIARLGFLSLDLANNPRGTEAFRQGLRDLGYVEGRNIVIEFRDAGGKPERLSILAAELVALKVDVIFAPTVAASLAAKQATGTLPVVFSGVSDPVADGLVPSLARPGGNVTGLSNLAPELVGKRLDLLKQAVPGVTRVGVLWQPGGGGERTDKDILTGAETAARALGMQIQLVEARTPGDLDRAFADMIKARADALLVLPYVMLFFERRRVVDLAAKSRLPGVYSARQFVEAGGLMAYGANLNGLSRRAASYVDRILKGAKPGDLPVEQPTEFELVVNLKTARTLGITIPQSVLGRADEIFP